MVGLSCFIGTIIGVTGHLVVFLSDKNSLVTFVDATAVVGLSEGMSSIIGRTNNLSTSFKKNEVLRSNWQSLFLKYCLSTDNILINKNNEDNLLSAPFPSLIVFASRFPPRGVWSPPSYSHETILALPPVPALVPPSLYTY